MLAPCLVHMLDAYFSSLVMAKLHETGVRDFVGIHDCWLVSKGIRIGDEVIDGDVSAHSPRLQRTLLDLGFLPAAFVPGMVFHQTARWDGPVYESLTRYLKDHPKWGTFVRAIRAQWERRVGVEPLPTFASRPA